MAKGAIKAAQKRATNPFKYCRRGVRIWGSLRCGTAARYVNQAQVSGRPLGRVEWRGGRGRVNCLMTTPVIDIGNKVMVYRLTLLSGGTNIAAGGSVGVKTMTEELRAAAHQCSAGYSGFSGGFKSLVNAREEWQGKLWGNAERERIGVKAQSC